MRGQPQNNKMQTRLSSDWASLLIFLLGRHGDMEEDR